MRNAWIHITIFIATLLAAFGVAVAQDIAVKEEDVPVPAQAQEVVVEINKGRMIKLDRPIASVAISDPLTADVQVVSQQMLFVRGKKVGETTLYATDAADNMVFSAVLQVTHNISKLQEAVKRVSPDSDITFRSVDGGLVMEGTSPSVDDSAKIGNMASAFLTQNEKLVNMVKTAGSDQVTLQVKIVELQRNSLKDLGINLQNVSVNGDFAMQILQGEDITNWPNNEVTTPLHLIEPSSVIARSTQLNSNFYFKYKSMGGLIDALETQGLATVLAEPSLTTTSGKAASFLAGGQFPLPVAGSNGNITLQYQPFGVSLNFTPMVMNKDRISLTVAPEVSTLDFNNPIQVSGITYPILSTRKASSVVELGSGQSFMLAGLLQKEVAHTIRKFPGLGNLPVLGALFTSQSFQNDQSELVIIVTPYIVRPVSQRDKLQVPTDGYIPPNDLQRLLHNNLYQQEPMDDDASQTLPASQGGGFILGE